MDKGIIYRDDCYINNKGFLGFCGDSWQETQMYSFIFYGFIILLILLVGMIIWKKNKKVVDKKS